MSWKCKRLQARLLDYHYGLLDERKSASVEKHLSGCEACKLELESMRAATEFVSQTGGIEPSQTTDDAIMRAARRKAAEFSGQAHDESLAGFPGLFKHSFVTALTAIIVMTALYFYYGTEEPPEFEPRTVMHETPMTPAEENIEEDVVEPTTFAGDEMKPKDVSTDEGDKAVKEKVIDKIKPIKKPKTRKRIKKRLEYISTGKKPKKVTKKKEDRALEMLLVAKTPPKPPPMKPEKESVPERKMDDSKMAGAADYGAMEIEMERDDAPQLPPAPPKAPAYIGKMKEKRDMKPKMKMAPRPKGPGKVGKKKAESKTGALFRKARALEKKGDCEGAARIYRKVASKAKNKKERKKALYRAGNCFARQKKHLKAKNFYDEMNEEKKEATSKKGDDKDDKPAAADEPAAPAAEAE